MILEKSDTKLENDEILSKEPLKSILRNKNATKEPLKDKVAPNIGRRPVYVDPISPSKSPSAIPIFRRKKKEGNTKDNTIAEDSCDSDNNTKITIVDIDQTEPPTKVNKSIPYYPKKKLISKITLENDRGTDCLSKNTRI